MKRSIISVGVAVTAVLVALSGCGKGGSSAPAAKEDTLTDFFGGNDPAAQQAQFDRQQREREERVAKCMRAQGFEYTPFVPKNTFQIPPQPKPGKEVEFKRKNGYGMADGMAQSGNLQQTAQENPNEARAVKMSEGERNAYQKALYGFDPTKPPTGDATENFQPKGCQNEGFKQQEDAWKPLQSKFEALQKKTEADPEIAKLNAKFVGCMKKAGYTISKENDIYEKVLGPKQNKIYEETYNSSQPSETVPAGGTPPPPPTIPQAKIDEFRKFELKVAGAEADCRPQKDVNKITDLRASYEKAFIEENRTALEKARQSQG